jgi:hypothetical protein
MSGTFCSWVSVEKEDMGMGNSGSHADLDQLPTGG